MDESEGEEDDEDADVADGGEDAAMAEVGGSDGGSDAEDDVSEDEAGRGTTSGRTSETWLGEHRSPVLVVVNRLEWSLLVISYGAAA